MSTAWPRSLLRPSPQARADARGLVRVQARGLLARLERQPAPPRRARRRDRGPPGDSADTLRQALSRRSSARPCSAGARARPGAAQRARDPPSRFRRGALACRRRAGAIVRSMIRPHSPDAAPRPAASEPAFSLDSITARQPGLGRRPGCRRGAGLSARSSSRPSRCCSGAACSSRSCCCWPIAAGTACRRWLPAGCRAGSCTVLAVGAGRAAGHPGGLPARRPAATSRRSSATTGALTGLLHHRRLGAGARPADRAAARCTANAMAQAHARWRCSSRSNAAGSRRQAARRAADAAAGADRAALPVQHAGQRAGAGGDAARRAPPTCWSSLIAYLRAALPRLHDRRSPRWATSWRWCAPTSS